MTMRNVDWTKVRDGTRSCAAGSTTYSATTCLSRLLTIVTKLTKEILRSGIAPSVRLTTSEWLALT